MARPRLRDVVEIVALAARARHRLDASRGDRHLAPALSAGALHAVRPVVVTLAGPERVFAYDPVEHTVDQLTVRLPGEVLAFRTRVFECLPAAHGTALAFLGDNALASAAYDHPETLLWRDSGALQQTLAMIAHAEGHAFCALGLHGAEVARALNLADGFVALGAAIIGRRA